MAVSICDASGVCKDTAEKAAGSFKPVAKLLVCILIVLFFMLYAGPKLGQLPWFKPMADFIEERDIKANMYFYTEVEEFSEANINMNNTMAYPPGASRQR